MKKSCGRDDVVWDLSYFQVREFLFGPLRLCIFGVFRLQGWQQVDRVYVWRLTAVAGGILVRA